MSQIETELPSPLRLVEVVWVDPASKAGSWTPLSEVLEDYRKKPFAECRTAGYVIHEDDKAILVAGSLGEENTVGDVMIVPRPLVKEIRELSLVESEDAVQIATTGKGSSSPGKGTTRRRKNAAPSAKRPR